MTSTDRQSTINAGPFTRTGSRKRLQSQSGINQSLSESAPRCGMIWEKADTADIDPRASYLVSDNGEKWGDFDLHVMRGVMVQRRLKPDYVRGRPEWIVKITRPPAPA